jgi:hypothetical protein
MRIETFNIPARAFQKLEAIARRKFIELKLMFLPQDFIKVADNMFRDL